MLASLRHLPTVRLDRVEQALPLHAGDDSLQDGRRQAHAFMQIRKTDAAGFFESQGLQNEMSQGVDGLFAQGDDRRFDPVQEGIADGERERLKGRELPPPSSQSSAAGKDEGRSTIHERLHTVP